MPTAVFSHLTALRIARAAREESVSLKRASLTSAPNKVPTQKHFEALADQLERAFPGLRLDMPFDCLTRNRAVCSSSPIKRIHLHQHDFSAGDIYELKGIARICSPAFAALLESKKLSFIQMLLLLFEICGTYTTDLTGIGTKYNAHPLCSRSDLKRFVKTHSQLHGSKAFDRALDYLADNSASPFETKLSLLLSLPHRYGGYGLGMPVMNYRVCATPQAQAIAGRRRFYCDLAWPKEKVDVEYQSKEHHEGRSSRLSDSRRAHALASMGWTVIGITDTEILNMHDMDVIAHIIERKLGKRKRVYIKDLDERKMRLRRQLSLNSGRHA